MGTAVAESRRRRWSVTRHAEVAEATEAGAAGEAGEGSGDVVVRVPLGPTEAGWFPDQTARGQLRYYDGRQWTDRIARLGN